jgi:hypothetical protein
VTFVSVHYSDAEHPLAHDFEGDILHFKFQSLTYLLYNYKRTGPSGDGWQSTQKQKLGKTFQVFPLHFRPN